MGTDGYFHYIFSYFFYTTKINIIVLTKVINFKKLKKIHIIEELTPVAMVAGLK